MRSADKKNVSFAGATFGTPLWLASGTFGWGVEASSGYYFPRSGAGAYVTKGLSLKARVGGPQPRLCEVAGGAGLLNAIGLQNLGVDQFISTLVPRYKAGEIPVPIWVNVFGEKASEYVSVIEALLRIKGPWLIGFELNVSCPNTAHGGLEFGSDPAILSALVKSCAVAAGSLPIMVKLSPSSTLRIEEASKICEEAGAKALSLCNTLVARSENLARKFGGQSGPALRGVSLAQVNRAAESCGLDICGVGGVSSAADFRAYSSAGAKVVQIGTANLSNPWVADEIYEELSELW